MTNQHSIVERAKYCYEVYPTIVNNIPKEKNRYNDELISYAKIDNNIAAANMAVGESSNLAQIALTYSYNFDDQKYKDYVCILSVLAQCSIDNAKRKFDVDLNKEIRRIKHDLDVVDNGIPLFFDKIKKRNAQRRIKNDKKNMYDEDLEKSDYEILEELAIQEMIENGNYSIKKEKKKPKLNMNLHCPMNYLHSISFEKAKYQNKKIPMDYFFQKFSLEENRRKSKKVEDLIEKYSMDVYNLNTGEDDEDYLITMNNLEELIDEIKSTYISKNYIGLMSWLIDRAFKITPSIKSNVSNIDTNTNKNKPLLLKVLYDVNKENLLECFSKNISKTDEN